MDYPFDVDQFLRNRTRLVRAFDRSKLSPIKVALLGGATTAELKSSLEFFLLAAGWSPTFYESGFGQYFEEPMFHNESLRKFRPDVALIYTHWRNVTRFPSLLSSASDCEKLSQEEFKRFSSLWERLHKDYGCQILQNNFDFPNTRLLGNREAEAAFSRNRFLTKLNELFADFACSHPYLRINDIQFLSRVLGASDWCEPKHWYGYKMSMSPRATAHFAFFTARILAATFGKTKKCLVVDLDNTLWGGVIGDDGLEGIQVGADDNYGEGFLDFQNYLKALAGRGILLAVCSKNEEKIAKNAFSHPGNGLRLEDFVAFEANWEPKPENIKKIAKQLNLGLESLVFVDDNPAERALVRAALPQVAVPEVGEDVTRFAEIIDRNGYFEPGNFQKEDLERTSYYKGNALRESASIEFQNYEEFLKSLDMTAEIGPVDKFSLERAVQLVQKTNQFNLTTKRFSPSEMRDMVHSPQHIVIQGRLRDRFGDNGIISLVIGKIEKTSCDLLLWLMSCRVLKRTMEYAMFDELVRRCSERGVKTIRGKYIRTERNALVSTHYQLLGFEKFNEAEDGSSSEWRFAIPASYQNKCLFIQREKNERNAA